MGNKNERSLPEDQDELSPCIEKEKDSQKEEVCSDTKDTSSTSGNTEVLPSSGVKEEVIPKLEKKEDASPSEEKKNISSTTIADNQEDFSEADVSNLKEDDSSSVQANERDGVGEDSKDKDDSDGKSSIATSTTSITTTSVTKVSMSNYEENIVVSSRSETHEEATDQKVIVEKEKSTDDNSKENKLESTKDETSTDITDDNKTNVNTERSPDKIAGEKDASSGSTAAKEVDEECIADNEEIGPKSGVLVVKVIEGSELEDKDKSQTVNNSLEPQWNFTANLGVSEDDSNSN